MNKVKQTVLHDPDNGLHGNCLSAVLSSLLHIDIDLIPTFSSATWVCDLNNWLRPHGLAYLELSVGQSYLQQIGISGLHHTLCGTSPRNAKVSHAVVGIDGVLAFDPHPDDTGLAEGSIVYGMFLALSPWMSRTA